MRDVSAVFLVWTLPFPTAPAVVERIARHARRVVFLSAPHRTPHPFFQQPNPMAKLHADIERLLADAGMASTVIRPGMFAPNARAGGDSGGSPRWCAIDLMRCSAQGDGPLAQQERRRQV